MASKNATRTLAVPAQGAHVEMAQRKGRQRLVRLTLAHKKQLRLVHNLMSESWSDPN